MSGLRPTLEVLARDDIERIVGQACAVLRDTGFGVENVEAQALLAEAGAEVRDGRAFVDEALVRGAVATAPTRVSLWDRDGEGRIDLAGREVHFDPGSAALNILDAETQRWRRPTLEDCARFAWVAEDCRHLTVQSTAMVPGDVPEVLGDRVRLAVALLNGRKPVVTGTFSKDAFAVMKDLLVAVRGSAQALRERPLAIFDCCPTPPLRWSDLTCQSLMDCARWGIPATLISMPLGGATAPVTLREMVVQHCAESLSGVLIHQLATPGAPIIWGGAPSIFDMRHGTTPLAAVETSMVNVGNAQVGRHLGLPTHGYLGLSDAKVVDHQAGWETSQGLVMAALAGINLVAGPGMLGFVGCQSPEKLLLDDQAAGAALRLIEGVSGRSADQATGLLADVVEQGDFLGHKHTRRSFRKELLIPRRLVDRAPEPAWRAAGALDGWEAAKAEVARIVAKGNPAPLEAGLADELRRLVRSDAARLGVGG